ncbi:hypothetical protein M2322_002770 [Rhodoblastus acidophilus]|uniref:hypothetical protein n=1 Tax=Rhodoblastus acidophilus TaxID=1074 RepID=UPI002224635C|nr:hypothetical protein [Rhodoblastus acidophilus]MCW2317216.1 hypothetical protein [Rhodoblastus acidophilus]
MKLISIELQALQIVTVLDAAIDAFFERHSEIDAARAASIHLFAACATADRMADGMKCSSNCAAQVFNVARSLEKAITILAGAGASRRVLNQAAVITGQAREAMVSLANAHDDCEHVGSPVETQIPPLHAAG